VGCVPAINMQTPFSMNSPDRIWKPNVTVAAIIQRDERFLIVEEVADGRTVFNQPAGHLDEGESLIEAVQREAMEETGCRFEPDAVVGLYLYPSREAGTTYLRICFSGTCSGDPATTGLDKGILRAVWMTRDELARAERRLRSPLVLRCIDDFHRGRQFPLDILAHITAG